LVVNSVVQEFGKFMKFIVHFSEDVCVVTVHRPNAFDILKQSQLEISMKKYHHVFQKELKRISYIMKLFATLK